MSKKDKRVRGVYGKPLLGDIPDEHQIEKLKNEALERAGKYAVEEVKKEIKRSSWNRKPNDLIDSFSYEVKGSTMIIKSDHPATKYVDKGVKPHQMIYLEKAKRPIPIITDSGDVIFRTPSSQSMKDGGWQHPGFKGKHFLDRGVEKARERVKKEMVGTYTDIVKGILSGDS